jgi:hypothetical protein
VCRLFSFSFFIKKKGGGISPLIISFHPSEGFILETIYGGFERKNKITPDDVTQKKGRGSNEMNKEKEEKKEAVDFVLPPPEMRCLGCDARSRANYPCRSGEKPPRFGSGRPRVRRKR